MIERNFDISFIADLALREKQIQQNYRPFIAVHKWFARRPGTLFRGLVLSEFVRSPLSESFYQSNNLHGLRIADPFIGGGTPLLEANRVGCDVVGYDINPMAYWIVRQEIEHLDLAAYQDAAIYLRSALEKDIGYLYRTTCLLCGTEQAHVKYFLWVKTLYCRNCGKDIRLFPGYLISQNRRHPKNVILCSKCGNLSEKDDRTKPGECDSCGHPLNISGPAKRGRSQCSHCGAPNSFPVSESGPPKHTLFAIEYHCPTCKPQHNGRFFKKPDANDLSKFQQAQSTWAETQSRFIPDDEIPPGDETNRLHRWGYRQYSEMFNSRQLLGLELSCRIIDKQPDNRIRNALATNLSDLLRYQNMFCRYDAMALKSLDIFSVHGFPVSLVQCESNLLGIKGQGRGTNIGSGGWSNIIEKFVKAKSYCDHPFEYRRNGGRNVRVPVSGEWIGDKRNNNTDTLPRQVEILCADATRKELSPASLDAVFTDPPYFGNVQYAELMDFCYVWLRKLLRNESAAFHPNSTRNPDELTVNENMGRDLAHFTKGLSRVFQQMAYALKPGSPLAFTYHHNNLKAYYPVAVAILDAGLTCSASLPCPAEMSASIHISKTGSSIIDTILVCRSTGIVPRKWIQNTPDGVAQLVKEDIRKLQDGNVKPTVGDIRCIAFGHLIRLAVWFLREDWTKETDTDQKIQCVSNWIEEFGGFTAIESHVGDDFLNAPKQQNMIFRENKERYGEDNAEVSF